MRVVFYRGDKLKIKFSEYLALGQINKEFYYKIRRYISKTLDIKIENF